MRLPSPLLPGRLVRRYKRFFVDVELENGETATAHCPNTGTMLGVCEPGSRVWLSRSANPRRKLALTWELVLDETLGGSCLVGINPMRPNAIAEEAILAGVIPTLSGYGRVRREVRYGAASRVDLVLEDGARPPCYVEVKNVHLRRRPGLAEFPDAVTSRGARHLRDLTAMVEQGNRALMVYLVQRDDCDHVGIAGDIDPAYAEALEAAYRAGVEVAAIGCDMSLEEIVGRRLLDLAA